MKSVVPSVNPFYLYIVYIMGTLFVAYSPFSGFYPLSIFPMLLSALAIFGLFLGFIAKIPPPAPRRLTSSPMGSKGVSVLVLLIGFVPLIPAFLQAMFFVFNNGFYEYTKFAHWGDGNYPAFFLSTNHLSVVQNISLAFLLGGLCIGMAGFFMEGKKKLLAFSALGLIMWAFITSSRLHVLFVVLSFVFCMMYVLHAKRSPSRQRLVGAVYIVVALALLVIFLTFLRVGSSFSGFSEHMWRYVVGYHTYGYALLDAAFNGDSPAYREGIGLGKYSFPLPSFFYQQFSVRFFDYRPEVPYRSLGYSMQEFVEIGRARDGGLIEVNAFYTALWPLWLDFRVGVLFFFFLFGFFTRRIYEGFSRHGDTASLSVLVFLSLAGYVFFLGGGVGQPVWWSALILLSLFYIFERGGRRPVAMR